MSTQLYFQYEDGRVRHIRGLKEFAVEWGRNKSLFYGRILILDLTGNNNAVIQAELTPYFLAAMVDDLLAARVYFEKSPEWENVEIYTKYLKQIPYSEQSVGMEINISRDDKYAEILRWHADKWEIVYKLEGV